MTEHSAGASRPWPNTYRLPGETIFAGEYPGDHDPDAARDKLGRLLDHGVRAFVDLTRPVDGLSPYADLLDALARERGVDVQHLPLPVPDMGIPEPEFMQGILDAIDLEARAGRGVYVHCWGGIGRTGTAVACLLMRRGLDAEAALDEVQRLYSTMPKSQGTHRYSPQTREQQEFVRQWREPESSDAHAALPSAQMAIDADTLLAQYPPRFAHPHKVALAARLLGGTPVQGTVHVSQWHEGRLPTRLPARAPAVELREGFFRYDPAEVRGDDVHWHVNFADPDLFGYYAGGLLAQDELQVLEHPLLGAVREWLLASGGPRLVVGADGAPTPILVAGVERRGYFRTAVPNADGSLQNLYGNGFSHAPREVVERALEVFAAPTMSNIIAIAARGHGAARYSHEQIAWTLRMALVGFAAACRESRRLCGDAAETVVHTGWWGCGAFGGNRELMALVQLAAAQCAGVDRVVFHRGFDDLDDVAGRAHALWLSRYRTADSLDALVLALFDAGYQWGQSNGT